MTTEAFFSPKMFQDKKHFPYGFARSGVFTKKQTTLLEKHGYAMALIASGEQAPSCTEEQQFLAFCQGARPAESDFEKVWSLYRQQVGKKPGYVSMEAGKSGSREAEATSFADDDELETLT